MHPIFVHVLWDFSIPCLQKKKFLKHFKRSFMFFHQKNVISPKKILLFLGVKISIFLQIILYGNLVLKMPSDLVLWKCLASIMPLVINMGKKLVMLVPIYLGIFLHRNLVGKHVHDMTRGNSTIINRVILNSCVMWEFLSKIGIQDCTSPLL